MKDKGEKYESVVSWKPQDENISSQEGLAYGIKILLRS